MDVVVISSEQPTFEFRADTEPKATIHSGDTIRIRTSDDFYTGLTSEAIDRGAAGFYKANALAGPIFVSGAQPGDALGVRIDAIEVGEQAFAVYVARWRRSMFGIADSRVVEARIIDGRVQLLNGGSIEIVPMIGCIGVAPRDGVLSSMSPTAPTGGNMDLVELVADATIWLPIQVEGALLSLGDLHARMGRGEPFGSGLECAGEVTATVYIDKATPLTGPIVCDGTRISFVGAGNDLTEAECTAVRAAWNWLTLTCGVKLDVALVITAALLNVNHGGPAGSNVVANFELEDLRAAGVALNEWPLVR